MILIWIVVVGFAEIATSVTPLVKTTSGTVKGALNVEATAFYGMRYAEPPVGDFRWKDPVPIASPAISIIDATINNHIQCYQNFDTCTESVDEPCSSTETEDCLVLNVFVPAEVDLLAPSPMLPVMVYIHGGGFKYGAGTSSDIDGKSLANITKTVVVTINYRLGPFGFLVLREDGEEDINGNQGLKDQQLAFKWVQENIGNFGGNSSQVMIFGNSAGAQSVMLHLISRYSRDLFSCAIQQSNPVPYAFIHPDVKGAIRISQRLEERLGCSNASSRRQCLLDASPDVIMTQSVFVEQTTAEEEGSLLYADETFFPIIDGVEFNDLPLNMIETGNWSADKDVIVGVNTEEFEELQFYYPRPWDEKKFLEMNQNQYGQYYGKLITEKYKEVFCPIDGDYRKTYSEEQSHYFMDCPNQRLARFASQSSKSSVYFYTNANPVLSNICVQRNNGDKANCSYAVHTSEIRYIFRTVARNDDYDDHDSIVENEFSTYWGNFAHSCRPSSSHPISLGNFSTWPKYGKDVTPDLKNPWSFLLITTPTSEIKTQYRTDICKFWESINYATSDGDETTTELYDETTSRERTDFTSHSAKTNEEPTTSNGHIFQSIQRAQLISCISFFHVFLMQYFSSWQM